MAGEWETSPLGELVELRTGKLDSNEADPCGPYPFFTCAPEPLRIGWHVFDCDAVLLAGNNANGIFHLNRYKGKFNAYQRTYVITPKENSPLDIGFLSYALRTLTQQLGEFSQGTATKFLTMGILSQLPIPLPPLPEQRAIARILGSLDDKIELNRRRSRTLEAMARAIFQSWFVDFDPVRAKAAGRQPPGLSPVLAALFPDRLEDSPLGPIPAGWRVGTVGEVCEFAYGKALKAEQRRPGRVAVMGSNGQVGVHNEALVSGPGVVVGRKGNPGVVTWVQSDFYPIDTTFYVVPLHGVCPLAYLYHALDALNVGDLGADSAVPGLNRTMAYRSQLLIPPKPVLVAFERRDRTVRERIATAEAESHTLAALRDSLLPKLISGEIRAPIAEHTAGRAI